MTKLDDAITLAKKSHAGQMRSNGKPYIIHCLEVMKLMQNFTTDEDLLCAAVLHDVPEDTKVTIEDIENKFGTRVAYTVSQVTRDKQGNFNLITPEAKLLKMCDRIHNLSDMDGWVEEHVFKYLGETRTLLVENYL